ncbi:unnamed protein product, partial [Laminaria digitata]
MIAAGAFKFNSAAGPGPGLRPAALPLLSAGVLPSSFFPSEAGGAARPRSSRRRNQLRRSNTSEEIEPLKQTVVATVAGSPDVSAEGVPLGEGFDGRVRLLGKEKKY